jgi:hypothetical protein
VSVAVNASRLAVSVLVCRLFGLKGRSKAETICSYGATETICSYGATDARQHMGLQER